MRYPNRLLRAVAGILISSMLSCGKDVKVPATSSGYFTAPNTASATSTTGSTSQSSASASTGASATSQSPYFDASTADPDDGLPYTGCCKTQNVIIIVLDGPRYSETFGDYSRKYIPNHDRMYTRGVLLGNFYNMGTTNTDSGHDAICTGNYENLENTGQELPTYPSIFQQYLKATGKPAEAAWVVASKDKLEILANCKTEGWNGKYMPRTDCGINGLFSGYRDDDVTFQRSKSILTQYHPNLMLINFKDADVSGHSALWAKYVASITKIDAYIKALYDQIEADSVYKGKTTVIITNDHGRHLNNVADGFVSHGDGCEGCRHILFLALGPDFKQGAGFDQKFEQIDISATIAKLLHFNMDYGKGKVIDAIFK